MEPHKLTYMSDEEWDAAMEADCIWWTEDDLIIPGVHIVVEFPEAQKLDGAMGIGGFFWPMTGTTPAFVCEKEWYDSIVD